MIEHTTKKQLLQLGMLAIKSLSKLPARTNIHFEFNAFEKISQKIEILYFFNGKLDSICLYLFLPYEENLHRLQSAIIAIKNESLEEFTKIKLNSKDKAV